MSGSSVGNYDKTIPVPTGIHKLRIGSLHMGQIIDIMARALAELVVPEIGFRNKQV